MTVKKALVKKADHTFVEGWREAYKWLSVQLAMVFGLISAVIIADPDMVAQVLDHLPDEIKPFMVLFITIIPIFARLKKAKDVSDDMVGE